MRQVVKEIVAVEQQEVAAGETVELLDQCLALVLVSGMLFSNLKIVAKLYPSKLLAVGHVEVCLRRSRRPEVF